MNLVVSKDFNILNGQIEIPSDKSLSHRAIIFSSLAKGKSVIYNFSKGKDPISSLNICKSLGVDIEQNDSVITVNSNGEFNKPSSALDCGNSGTTMRLMAGILAGQNFDSVLKGDESLSKRPMKRIVEPLSLMGADINSDSFHSPLNIRGANLHGINYESAIASAQVKSCVLLAGLFAQGATTYKEIYPSRNHTEIMLSNMGANITCDNNLVKIEKSELKPLNINICGDISSAAYFIVAGLIVPNSEIILKNIGLNPTRSGIIEVTQKMGGSIEILDQRNVCGELVGDVKVEYTQGLKGIEIGGEIIPALIDEIPVIALLATQCDGQTIIKDASDLRNKESDRIKTTVSELKKLGVNIKETADGMIIQGKTKLKGDVEVDSNKDHRLAMTLYVAGLICEKEISIKDFEWVNISFPEFLELFEKLK